MLKNLLKVSDDELAFTGDGEKEAKPQWMAQLAELAQQWLKLLPKVRLNLTGTIFPFNDFCVLSTSNDFLSFFLS